MLKRFIIMENGKSYQYDSLEDIVKNLIDEDYYNLSNVQKKEKMKTKVYANMLNNKNIEIVKRPEYGNIQDFKDKFIIKDEITYILSLLNADIIVLLERIDSNIFTKNIDKSQIQDNYIIVNTFSKELMKEYIN